jgi:transposase-like protein
MDKITHEMRLANWKPIVQQCLNRPESQTVKQWLDENGINEKQYYYWLRKIRQEAYAGDQLPAPMPHTEVSFAEIRMDPSVENDSLSDAAVIIRTTKACIQISGKASPALVKSVMKAVAHVL